MNGTMKRAFSWKGSRNAIVFGAILVACLSSMGLSSCSNVISGPHGEAGTLTVTFGSGARTILPNFASLVDSVEVTLSASGQSDQTLTSSSLGGSLTFTGLAATTWTIGVSALSSDGTEIGTGSASVTVSAGDSQSVSVPISFSGFNSGTGNLSIALSWPESTGVDYLSWNIDSGSATEVTATASSNYYTTTLNESGLTAGARILHLSFKKDGSTGTSAGNFVEIVDIFDGQTSSSWIDGSGIVQSVMSFLDADFLSSNSSLGGLSFHEFGSSTELVTFESTTTSYTLTTAPTASSLVVTPTESITGQYISYTWNGGSSTSLASGDDATLTYDFSIDDTLVIAVRAPDGETTKTYTIIWNTARVEVTFDLGAESLGFSSSSTTVAQGDVLTITCANSTLASEGTSWVWYVDGASASTGSSSFAWPTSSVAVGHHIVSCTVTYNGISYSGAFRVTVTQ